MVVSPTPAELDDWCGAHLGSPPARVLFEARHLSIVRGYELRNGMVAVVKARTASTRVVDAIEVQRHLHRRGFPCPRPLAEGQIGDRWAVSAEEYMPRGRQLLDDRDRPKLFAEALSWLVREAPALETVPAVADPLPWVGWNHGERGLWPRPDDLELDLNDHDGPSWLDDMAARVRRRLQLDKDGPVVGHGDWESQNLRWTGKRLYCVFDWDSVIGHSEPSLVGAAAAVFTATGAPGTEATLDDSDAFIRSYERASERRWRTDQIEVAWAAGLWVRAFNARKAVVVGGPTAIGPDVVADLTTRLERSGA